MTDLPIAHLSEEYLREWEESIAEDPHGLHAIPSHVVAALLGEIRLLKRDGGSIPVEHDWDGEEGETYTFFHKDGPIKVQGWYVTTAFMRARELIDAIRASRQSTDVQEWEVVVRLERAVYPERAT